MAHPLQQPGAQLQVLSKNNPLLAESWARTSQEKSLSQTEVFSSMSSAVFLEEEKPSKRKAADESHSWQNPKT